MTVLIKFNVNIQKHTKNAKNGRKMPMNPSDKQNKFLRCHYTTVQFGSSFFDVIGFQVQKLVPFQFGWIVIQNCVILKDSIKFMVVKRNSPLRFENVEHFGVVHES